MTHIHWETGEPCNCGFTSHLKPRTAKTSALTRNQRLRMQENWNQTYGPDTAPVARQFPDGWSIRQLRTNAHENYEGEMMPNCLGSAASMSTMRPEDWNASTSIGSNPEYTYYSVRDPDNLPHGTFSYDPENDTHFFDLGLEGRAGANASKYVPYVHDWWKSIGGRPLTPSEWEDSEYDNDSTTEGMPEYGSPEHQQAAEDPGWGTERKPEAWWEKPKESWGSYVPESVHRAGKPLNKATQMDRAAGEEFLRQRLPNNFKPQMVDHLLQDYHAHRDRLDKYNAAQSGDDIQPYTRREFPEFFWMHGSYGPDAYNQVKQTNELYRNISWNHPAAFSHQLVNNLVTNADIDPTQAEDIANRWVNAHLQARGMQADAAPRVQQWTPGGQQGYEAMRDMVPPESLDRLKPYFQESVPDPNWDPAQAWSQPPKYLARVSALAKPLYRRWVFSPASGEVSLSDNRGDPLEVRYHQDLARELNEPGLVHGYAYPIGGGHRLTDLDHAPVQDPFVLAQVMRALRGEPSARTARSTREDWTRLHYGMPC